MPYSNTLLRQSRAYLSVRSNAIVIILDFKEDTESMIEDGGVIHAVPTAALEYTCFCLPTRFQCGGFVFASATNLRDVRISREYRRNSYGLYKVPNLFYLF